MARQTEYEQDGLPKIEMNINKRRNGRFDIRLNISILYDQRVQAAHVEMKLG